MGETKYQVCACNVSRSCWSGVRLVIVVFKYEKLRKDILRPVQTLLIYRFGKMTRHNKIISDDSKGKK